LVSLDARNPKASAIVWHGNVGELEVGAEWVKVSVKEGSQARFTATRGSSDVKAVNQ